MWCNCRLGALQKWKTPKLLTIHDWRLGALYHTLRLSVLVYVIVNVFYSGAYKWAEKPDATPTFWFESGDVYKAQNYNWGGYCNNTKYNYNFDIEGKSYWNDLDIECRAMHYAEMLTKTAYDGFVLTFMKEETTSSRQCSLSEDACLDKATGNRISRDSQILLPGSNQAVCTCAKLKDYFAHGVEEIELHIEHGFLATQKMDVAGSSTYEEVPEDERDKRKLIRTCLKETGMEENECFKQYEPGEKISLRLADWLMLAGVALDEHLKDTVTEDAKTGMFPYRRTVGTTLLIHLTYRGDATDDVFTCDIEVHNKDGWTSQGSEITYVNYESHQNMDFYDRYRRGVSIQFLAMGQATQFDFMVMLNTIIQGLVLLGLVEQVVLFVASYGLPESRVYLRAMSEPFRHAKAMAEFGVQTAMACQAFWSWNQSGTQINEKELMAVLQKGNLGDKSTEQLVRVIMKEARLREDGEPDNEDGNDLSCKDLIRIMSSGLVSLDELAKLQEIEEKEAAKLREKKKMQKKKLLEKKAKEAEKLLVKKGKEEAKLLAKKEKEAAKLQKQNGSSVSPADEVPDIEAKGEEEVPAAVPAPPPAPAPAPAPPPTPPPAPGPGTEPEHSPEPEHSKS